MVIQVLTPQLANQIAAGEVVERPSSIIKELVENSIDAGANRIDIDIEQGGCKLIRIRDNGCGIAKDELPLALTRHATSKIRTLDDLDAIISLGFRGEALASISSVSRLTLTSNTATQSEAWQVYAEGRDMLPTIKPASHPVGTTVEVLDIFYNTPARRRFLKSEKTEFSHIDEVVRRIALVAPTISINLQHNGKLVKQYRSAQSDEQIERRIAVICGSSFMQKSIKLSWQHDDLTIHGWLATNAGGEPLQYFYVNGRVIKDRLLNHALKQASLATRQANSTDETLSYVIYLELDPHQVDVNVHPAKHEVRFHEARLIHDFVYQGIVMALSRRDEKTLPLSSDMVSHELKKTKLTTNRLAAGHNIFNASPFDDHDLIQTNQHVDRVRPVNYQHNSKPTKTAHSIENRLYQDLVEHVERKTSLQEETISSHQQAVIQSLFPSRNTPLMTIENDIELSRAETLGRVLTIIKNRYVLLEKSHHQQQIISLLSLQKAQLVLFKQQIIRDEEGVSRERLLIPFTILLSKQEQQVTTQAIGMLHEFNLELVINDAKLQLNAVPKLMRKVNWQQLLPKLIGLLSEKALSTELKPLIYEWLIEQYLAYCREQATEWNVPQTIALLTELEQLNEQQIDIADMIKPIDLSTTIELFT